MEGTVIQGNLKTELEDGSRTKNVTKSKEKEQDTFKNWSSINNSQLLYSHQTL